MNETWYSLDKDEVLKKINVDKKGLNNKQVKENQTK